MRMSHTEMVQHLREGKGGLLIEGTVITREQDLPPVEEWHAKDHVALGDRLSEIEVLEAELAAKKEKILEAMTANNSGKTKE